MSQKCIINNLRQKTFNFYQKEHTMGDNCFYDKVFKKSKKKMYLNI